MGLASEFAAPMQITIVASRRPSYSANSSASACTGPRRVMPATQSGNGISGRSSSTGPSAQPPKTSRNATRISTIATPSQT